MIILAYSLVVSLLAFLVYFGIRSLYRWRKKTPLFPAKGWFADLIDGGSLLLLNFIVALFLGLLYGAYSVWNALFFLAVNSGIVLLFRPSWFEEKIKEKAVFAGDNRRKSILSLILGVFVLLEMFAFNGRAVKTNVTSTSYAFTETSVVVNSGTLNGDETSSFSDGGYFVFTSSDPSATTLYLDFVNTKSLDLTVTVDGYTSEGKTVGSRTYTLNPVVSDSCLVAIPSGADRLKVTFQINWGRANIGDNVTADTKITLRKFVLNAPIAFYFSALRFIACSLLAWLIVYFPSFMRAYDQKVKDLGKRVQLGVLLGGAIVFLGFSIYALLNRELYFSAYPLANKVEYYDIYTQMFDAFQHGQLNLRVDPSYTLWDHAYYNGLCYSYYGVLPVLLVSFPFYWLFHVVPTSIFLESIGAIVEVQVLLILVAQLYRTFVKKANPAVLYFGLVVAFFTALSPALVTYKRYYIGDTSWNPCVEANYHTPIVYGLLNMDLFFLLILYAVEDEKRRMLYLGLAGLAFGFLMASRPNLFICLIFALPFLIKMLLEKKEKVGHRLLNFVPMAAVLVLCAVGIGLYNKSRFGSFVDFGASHQNTVGDVSHLTIHANQIFPGLFHYFLNPWGATSNGGVFPFLTGTTPRITADSNDYSNYLSSGTGVLAIPFFWSLFLIPFCFQKDDDIYVKLTLILIPVSMIVLAIMTYSLAGICPRYLYEIYNLATLASLVAVGKTLDKETPDQRRVSVPTIAAVALFSIFICWNLSRDSFDGLSIADLNGWLERIREVFGSFNA